MSLEVVENLVIFKTTIEYMEIYIVGGNIELHAISSNNIPKDILGDNTIVMQITDESVIDGTLS